MDLKALSEVFGRLVTDDRETSEFVDETPIRLKGGLEDGGFVSKGRSAPKGLGPDRLRKSVGCCTSRLVAPFP
jgi:hypothetical protein